MARPSHRDHRLHRAVPAGQRRWGSWRPGGGAPNDMAHLDEWGLGGRSFGGWITWFLVGGDLYTAYTFVAVPALMFGAGAAGLLRRAVHDHHLPAGLPGPVPALVGVAPARLRHPGRLRPHPLRLAGAGAARRDHRHRRHDAVHRAAARRHRGGAQDDGRDRREHAGPAPADHHRVRDPGRVHLPVRAARARADRVRQGHADLHRDPGGGHLPAVQARRLGRRSSTRRRRSSTRRRTRTTASCSTPTTSCSTSPWRSARRWRCSSTRTASPACWPAGTAT